MRRVIILFSIVAISIVSCKDKKQTTEKDAVVPEQKTTEVAAADPAKDSTEIRTVVMDFYNWYTKNFAKFQEYSLYSGIKKKDMPPYKINWDQVAKYQDYIRASVPQLGEEFLANQKKFFQQCDSAFKVDTQDELPYGFDYDWYTNSQEDPSYLLDGINKSTKWMINVKGEEASVEIGAPDHKDYLAGSLLLYVGMKKENGKWTIAKISGIE
jgi:hypothetical protein